METFEVAEEYLRTVHDKLIEKATHVTEQYKCFEHTRSDLFAKILKEVYDKSLKISYKLPFEIQEFFELEIQVTQVTFVLVFFKN